MGADKLAENTPNTTKFIAQFVYPSPKVWDFDEERLHWAFVVRALQQDKGQLISKCLLGDIVSTKKPKKFLLKDFCPSLLNEVESKTL